MYTQALVDGYRVELRAGAIDAVFHTDMGDLVLRCDEGARLDGFDASPSD
jgi:hypothetical protein